MQTNQPSPARLAAGRAHVGARTDAATVPAKWRTSTSRCSACRRRSSRRIGATRKPRYLGPFVADGDICGEPAALRAGRWSARACGRRRGQPRHSDAPRRLLERIDSAASTSGLIALIDDVRLFSPCPVEVYEAMGVKLRRYDRPMRSAQLLREGVAVHPEAQALWREVGFCARIEERYDEARQCFETALNLNPSDPELLGMMGGLCKRVGELTQARTMYERAIHTDPEDLYPLIALSGLLVHLRDEEAALESYRSVMVLTERAVRVGSHDHGTHFTARRGVPLSAQISTLQRPSSTAPARSTPHPLTSAPKSNS